VRSPFDSAQARNDKPGKQKLVQEQKQIPCGNDNKKSKDNRKAVVNGARPVIVQVGVGHPFTSHKQVPEQVEGPPHQCPSRFVQRPDAGVLKRPDKP
jgi:hypothetical protein